MAVVAAATVAMVVVAAAVVVVAVRALSHIIVCWSSGTLVNTTRPSPGGVDFLGKGGVSLGSILREGGECRFYFGEREVSER